MRREQRVAAFEEITKKERFFFNHETYTKNVVIDLIIMKLV